MQLMNEIEQKNCLHILTLAKNVTEILKGK